MQKIAVLDDDMHWCNTIKRFFRHDFEVTTFQNIQSFLDSPIESYDLIIIDFAISPNHRYEPIKNGIEVITQLRESLQNPPKLVLVSAFISRNDPSVDVKVDAIADKLLPKDLGLEAILQTVKDLLATEND